MIFAEGIFLLPLSSDFFPSYSCDYYYFGFFFLKIFLPSKTCHVEFVDYRRVTRQKKKKEGKKFKTGKSLGWIWRKIGAKGKAEEKESKHDSFASFSVLSQRLLMDFGCLKVDCFDFIQIFYTSVLEVISMLWFDS